jgi:hypothetical protein
MLDSDYLGKLGTIGIVCLRTIGTMKQIVSEIQDIEKVKSSAQHLQSNSTGCAHPSSVEVSMIQFVDRDQCPCLSRS